MMIITIREKKSQDGASMRSAIKIERILDVPNNERVWIFSKNPLKRNNPIIPPNPNMIERMKNKSAIISRIIVFFLPFHFDASW